MIQQGSITLSKFSQLEFAAILYKESHYLSVVAFLFWTVGFTLTGCSQARV
jgi:hypothetical protein